MNTGQITWKIEETGNVTSHCYPELTQGTWIFGVTIYGAKVELLNGGSSVEAIQNNIVPSSENL